MKKATIVSKFPSRFIKNDIIPKLKTYGIEVDRIIEPAKLRDPLSFGDDEIVLVMHEMLSHSEYYRVKRLAKRANKQLIALSRKMASWHKALEVLAKPQSKSGKTNFYELASRVIDLRQQGKSLEEIAQEVKSLWDTSAPNGKNLHTFLSAALKQERIAPELADNLRKALQRQPSHSHQSQPITSDWQRLAVLYSEENERLRQENGLLVKQLEVDKEEHVIEDGVKAYVNLIEQQLSVLSMTVIELKKRVGE